MNASTSGVRRAVVIVSDMWVLYDSPSDYPGKIVARRWEVSTRPPKHEPCYLPTTERQLFATIDEARSVVGYLRNRLDRDPQDDPVIVECWI